MFEVLRYSKLRALESLAREYRLNTLTPATYYKVGKYVFQKERRNALKSSSLKMLVACLDPHEKQKPMFDTFGGPDNPQTGTMCDLHPRVFKNKLYEAMSDNDDRLAKLTGLLLIGKTHDQNQQFENNLLDWFIDKRSDLYRCIKSTNLSIGEKLNILVHMLSNESMDYLQDERHKYCIKKIRELNGIPKHAFLGVLMGSPTPSTPPCYKWIRIINPHAIWGP
jgi:hypothetical protein